MIVKSSNYRGFTYIEVLVALSILFITMMGILAAMGYSLEENMTNRGKDEAMQIAKQRMDELRTRALTSINSGTDTVKRKIGGHDRTFTVTWVVTNLGANSRKIDINIKWNFKKRDVQLYNASTIVSFEV